MINFIPLFPLNIVVFPGETLRLHIFEERYKQMIHDIDLSKKNFGIPCILENKVSTIGTLMQLQEVVKKYDDGKMDIITQGIQPFHIIETLADVPGKLYQGAIVSYPVYDYTANTILKMKVLAAWRLLLETLHIQKKSTKSDAEINSFDIAHSVGFSLRQEYELLGYSEENHRLEYLNRHLKKVLPIVKGMEQLKERIQLNGHFRELKGL